MKSINHSINFKNTPSYQEITKKNPDVTACATKALNNPKGSSSTPSHKKVKFTTRSGQALQIAANKFGNKTPSNSTPEAPKVQKSVVHSNLSLLPKIPLSPEQKAAAKIFIEGFYTKYNELKEERTNPRSIESIKQEPTTPTTSSSNTSSGSSAITKPTPPRRQPQTTNNKKRNVVSTCFRYLNGQISEKEATKQFQQFISQNSLNPFSSP